MNDLDPKGMEAAEAAWSATDMGLTWKLSDAIRAYLSATVPARCRITGNPVGTDTVRKGYQCPCSACSPSTVPAGDGELVVRLREDAEMLCDGLQLPGLNEAWHNVVMKTAAADCLEAASRLCQGTGVRDAEVQRLTEENEALTQNAESLLEIIDMRKARIKALEGAVKDEVFINGILYRRVSEVAKSSAETPEVEHIE